LPSDNSQLSPFVQVMNTLQQLQQSDPTQYQQVTQQIATNLQAAAQTAQSSGNTTAANQLNQLATDFTNASTSGQLPNIQDLAQAMGGHHHHHHHASATSSASSSSSSSSSSSTLNQLLAAFQTSATQNDSLDPTSIILNTLSSAGIGASNS
jgi:G3E family GTPase